MLLNKETELTKIFGKIRSFPINYKIYLHKPLSTDDDDDDDCENCHDRYTTETMQCS